MELSEERIKTIEGFVKPYHKLLCDTTDKIVNESVSNYPIFICTFSSIDVGIPILSEDAADIFINASTLEEFVAKQIVQMDKVDDFKKIFKPTQAHLCIFWVEESSGSFMFVPRFFTNS